MSVKNSLSDSIVFLLSVHFRMVFAIINALLDMLAVNDVYNPPPDNDDDSVVRSTMVRR